LSIFVTCFNYSKEDFDLLTPVQANLILLKKKEYDENNRLFLSNEFRTNNFYTVVFSGNAKKNAIKSPADLYKLDFDNKAKAKKTKMAITQSDVDFMFKQTGLKILPN